MFVTLPEVIEMVGRGEQYVLRQIQKGNLITPSNVDGEWIFTKTAVDRFLEDLPDEEPEDRDLPPIDLGSSDAPEAEQTLETPLPIVAQETEKPVPVMRVAEIPKTPEQKETKKTWDVAQISAELKLAKTRIYDDIHTGKLKAEMDGRKYVITEEDYLRYKSYLEEEQKRKMALEQAGCLTTLLCSMLVTLSIVLLLFLL